MEEKTTQEVAAIFAAAGDSVTVINTYKKVDGTTSIWTSESFTAIDAAVVAGKKIYE